MKLRPRALPDHGSAPSAGLRRRLYQPSVRPGPVAGANVDVVAITAKQPQ